MFKPKEKITATSIKSLNFLTLNERERKKTLILDDQRILWDVKDQSKIIPSKKFYPLNNKTSIKYFVFPDENLNWSILSGNYTIESGASPIGHQLKYLIESLAQLWNNWNRKDKQDELIDIEKIYEEFRNKILQGWKIAILSENDVERETLVQIVKIHGGEVVDIQFAHLVLIEKHLNPEKNKLLNQVLISQPLGEVKPISWLIELFFNIKIPNSLAFYYSSDLKSI